MFGSLFGRPPRGKAEEDGEENRLLRQVNAGGGRFERLVLTQNRRVMASIADGGRTLRLHEAFTKAPSPILTFLGVLFSSRSPEVRARAKAEIRHFLATALPSQDLSPARHRQRPTPRAAPGDAPHLERLRAEFDRVNQAFFGARLPLVPLRLSGRMRRRNGHFSIDPLEIAISRTLCDRAVGGEAERTLRHEMIHLWQWTEGRKPGHGNDFRTWARCLDVPPRATRTVCWAESAR